MKDQNPHNNDDDDKNFSQTFNEQSLPEFKSLV